MSSRFRITLLLLLSVSFLVAECRPSHSDDDNDDVTTSTARSNSRSRAMSISTSVNMSSPLERHTSTAEETSPVPSSSSSSSSSFSSEGRHLSGGGRRTSLNNAATSIAEIVHNETALMLSFLDAIGDRRSSYPTVNNTRTSTSGMKGHKRTGGTRREEGNIVFPTSPPKVHNNAGNRMSPTSIPCSTGDTLCERIDNYPSHEVNEVLSDAATEYSEYFESSDSVMDISLRTDLPEEASVQLCRSRSRVIVPEAAKNVNGEWRIIAKNDTYQQAIVVEECYGRNQACNFSELFPETYTATCEQKYITRRLVALNKDRKRFETDKFRVPSCCACVLKIKK